MYKLVIHVSVLMSIISLAAGDIEATNPGCTELLRFTGVSLNELEQTSSFEEWIENDKHLAFTTLIFKRTDKGRWFREKFAKLIKESEDFSFKETKSFLDKLIEAYQKGEGSEFLAQLQKRLQFLHSAWIRILKQQRQAGRDIDPFHLLNLLANKWFQTESSFINPLGKPMKFLEELPATHSDLVDDHELVEGEWKILKDFGEDSSLLKITARTEEDDSFFYAIEHQNEIVLLTELDAQERELFDIDGKSIRFPKLYKTEKGIALFSYAEEKTQQDPATHEEVPLYRPILYLIEEGLEFQRVSLPATTKPVEPLYLEEHQLFVFIAGTNPTQAYQVEKENSEQPETQGTQGVGGQVVIVSASNGEERGVYSPSENNYFADRPVYIETEETEMILIRVHARHLPEASASGNSPAANAVLAPAAVTTWSQGQRPPQAAQNHFLLLETSGVIYEVDVRNETEFSERP